MPYFVERLSNAGSRQVPAVAAAFGEACVRAFATFGPTDDAPVSASASISQMRFAVASLQSPQALVAQMDRAPDF